MGDTPTSETHAPVTINLGRKARTLTYSLTNSEAIERHAGKRLGDVLRDIARGSIQDTVTCLWIGVSGTDKTLTRDRVISLLQRDLDAGRLTLKQVIETVTQAMNQSSLFRGIVNDGSGDDEGGADDEGKQDAGSVSGSETSNETPTTDST